MRSAWVLVVGLALAACGADADGDGFAADDDCDDDNADVHPDAVEVCDDVDNDCDGVADPPTSQGTTAWWADQDADGWGLTSWVVRACDQPPGFAARGGDCDDEAEAVNPDATEIPGNGVDDDCDEATVD